MSTTNNKLNNPTLSDAEQDVIIGTFVRKYENARLRERWIDKLRTDYQVIRPATKMPGTQIRKIILPIITIAASLLLLLAFLPSMLKADGATLMASYLTEATIENSRSEPTNDLEQARTQFIDNYTAGQFTAAITAGEGVIKMPESTDEDHYYLGLAYLRNQHIDQAVANFKGLLGQPTDFSTEAHYYLGISLLANGETIAGLRELKKIEERDGQNIYEKAQALLKAKWD